MTTKKRLTSIKGISEAKVDKIKVFVFFSITLFLWFIYHNMLSH